MKKILIDLDDSIGFEVPSLSIRVRNIFLVPILNNLPKWLLPLVTKTNKAGREVVKYKTEHTALEILYQNGSTYTSENIIHRISFWILFNLDNPRAVRNRLRIVKRQIQNKLQSDFETSKNINLLSIAAGSARAVLESVANIIEKYPNQHISVTFLDKNPKATEYSRQLAEELHMIENTNISFHWVTETIGTYMKKVDVNEKFHIIEMVGLLDYFDDDKAVKVFTDIRSILLEGGLFVCANINNNRERKFITNFIDWNMIYRTGEDLSLLLEEAGFSDKLTDVVYEPLKIHSVSCAYKGKSSEEDL